MKSGVRSGRSVIAAGRLRREGPVIEPSWTAANGAPRLQTIPTCVSQRRGLVCCARTRSWLYSTQRVTVGPSPFPSLHPLSPHMSVNRLLRRVPLKTKLESDAKIGRPVRNNSKRTVRYLIWNYGDPFANMPKAMGGGERGTGVPRGLCSLVTAKRAVSA